MSPITRTFALVVLLIGVCRTTQAYAAASPVTITMTSSAETHAVTHAQTTITSTTTDDDTLNLGPFINTPLVTQDCLSRVDTWYYNYGVYVFAQGFYSARITPNITDDTLSFATYFACTVSSSPSYAGSSRSGTSSGTSFMTGQITLGTDSTWTPTTAGLSFDALVTPATNLPGTWRFADWSLHLLSTDPLAPIDVTLDQNNLAAIIPVMPGQLIDYTLTFNGNTAGTYDLEYANLNIALVLAGEPIPEPATLAMLAPAAMLLLRRRP